MKLQLWPLLPLVLLSCLQVVDHASQDASGDTGTYSLVIAKEKVIDHADKSYHAGITKLELKARQGFGHDVELKANTPLHDNSPLVFKKIAFDFIANQKMHDCTLQDQNWQLMRQIPFAAGKCEQTDTTGDDADKPMEDDTQLNSILVKAACGKGNGCLYHDSDKKYWLQCEIKGGGCGKGLHYRHENDKGKFKDAVFKDNRDSVCRDGNKTVADLAEEKITLICKTDEGVAYSAFPKKAELVLNKSHLENQHLCMITRAGKDQLIKIQKAELVIQPEACQAPTNNLIEFQTQLSFSLKK